MRLALFGTPADAVPALEALHEAGHDIALVVTQPDRRRGRGNDESPSPVRDAAEALGLPVRTPQRASEVVDDVAGAGAEVGVVVAFGQLLPPPLLEAVPHGYVNMHFSLLPRWRGAAPVERAMLAGDTETGVCIMALEAGLDTGPVFARERTAIGATETAGELRMRLVAIGTDLLVATLPRVPTTTPARQVGAPTYADKLTVEEFELDWTRPAVELARLVRAGNPRPGAWTTDHGNRLKLWRANPLSECIDAEPGTVFGHTRVATGEGALELVEIQPEGRRTMDANAWLAAGAHLIRSSVRDGTQVISPVVTARVVALDALVRVEDGAYAHVVLPAMLGQTNLDDRDRAFATDLVYGTVRGQRRIDDLLGRVVKRPIHRLDAPVRAALRLGAYQLLHDTPPHAAVDSTVEAVGARSPHAHGFVNANLRALTRLPRPWPEPTDDAVALSYPDWLVALLVDALGADDARAALVAMNEPAAVTLRPDPRRVTASALADELRAAGAEVETGGLVPDALVVRGLGDPGRLPAVSEGRATPQDQGSQAVVAVLAPEPGERIADLAAAPGGKATAIAERVGASGTVVALDVDAGRVRMIDGARHRIGLPHLLPVVGDGRRPPLLEGAFDRVLLDAPCSGIGVLRRRPDARWRLQPEVIDELAVLQREMLAAAAPLVRPGGMLVYSVCTVTEQETVAVDEWAADALHDFVALAPPGTLWRRHGRGALLLPQDAGTDGMYVLILQRTAFGVSSAP